MILPETKVAMAMSSLNGAGLPHSWKVSRKPNLSFTKRSLIVQTESNVHREKLKKPDPPCTTCSGTGRINCDQCRGRGRTNYTDLEMLPKGEWPKWCKTCGGSGLGYCPRCLGTGEYRYIMGFQFMKRDDSLAHEKQESGVRSDQKHHGVADFYDQ